MKECIVTSRFKVYSKGTTYIDGKVHVITQVVRVRYYPQVNPVVHYELNEFLRLHKPKPSKP